MKDYKYALDIMKQELDNKYICPEVKYAFEASIEALGKEIRMKVVDREHCPNCDKYLGCEGFEQVCCNECGQKLDWT